MATQLRLAISPRRISIWPLMFSSVTYVGADQTASLSLSLPFFFFLSLAWDVERVFLKINSTRLGTADRRNDGPNDIVLLRILKVVFCTTFAKNICLFGSFRRHVAQRTIEQNGVVKTSMI